MAKFSGPKNCGKSWLMQRIVEGDLAFSNMETLLAKTAQNCVCSGELESLESFMTMSQNGSNYKIVLTEDCWNSTDKSEREKSFSRQLVRKSHVALVCFALNDAQSVEHVLTSDFPLLIDLLGSQLALQSLFQRFS